MWDRKASSQIAKELSSRPSCDARTLEFITQTNERYSKCTTAYTTISVVPPTSPKIPPSVARAFTSVYSIPLGVLMLRFVQPSKVAPSGSVLAQIAAAHIH